MWVTELWRYPVKSMAGEMLKSADVSVNGIVGDRIVHAADAHGRVITARTRPGLLGRHASWDEDRAAPIVDGHPWDSDLVANAVHEAAGADVRLVRYEGPERFDVLPLLVATDGAIAALGVDRRRLRPNILVGGTEPEEERRWPGRRLRIGAVVIAVQKLRRRCVMTTFDPDTLEQDPAVLRRIVKEFGGRIALDCAVVEPGRITVGDPVHLL